MSGSGPSSIRCIDGKPVMQLPAAGRMPNLVYSSSPNPISIHESRRLMRPWMAVTLTLVLLAGCATGAGRKDDGTSGNGASVTRQELKTTVEALYLNNLALRDVYRDLRGMARAHLFLPDDDRLNQLQKICLYVDSALRTGMHQWEMLSIMDDIRPAATGDYFTLRQKSLAVAMDRTRWDQRFIDLYRTGIMNGAVQQKVDAAIRRIERNLSLFKRLMDLSAPLANPEGVGDNI